MKNLSLTCRPVLANLGVEFISLDSDLAGGGNKGRPTSGCWTKHLSQRIIVLWATPSTRAIARPPVPYYASSGLWQSAQEV